MHCPLVGSVHFPLFRLRPCGDKHCFDHEGVPVIFEEMPSRSDVHLLVYSSAISYVQVHATKDTFAFVHDKTIIGLRKKTLN